MASLNDIETKVQNIIDILSGDIVTGILPLTFTSHTAGNASDWEIRGNVQGVGERTVNLFDVNKVTDRTASGHTLLRVVNDEIIVNLTASTSTPDGDNHTLRDIVGNLELNQAYTLNATSTGLNKFIYLSGTGANFAWAMNSTTKTFTTQESLDAALDATVLWYASGANTTATISNIMLTKGSTAPSTYVPYGYEIPISVNGTPQTFYIGSSPLTEGQSISKSSTGVDIELFEGENTVSTTLTNKPEMTIKYKITEVINYGNSKQCSTAA